MARIYISQRLTRKKLTRIPGYFFAPFSTWFDSKILYTLDENAVPNRGERLYANSATAVDQICRFQGKIRIKVDKIA